METSAGTPIALANFVMKAWFVVFTLWAFAGMVALRTVYSEDESSLEQNASSVAVEP